MSRRSDRLGIAPERLSNPITSRWWFAHHLETAANWRKHFAGQERRQDRESARAHHGYEIGMAAADRGRRDWSVIP